MQDYFLMANWSQLNILLILEKPLKKKWMLYLSNLINSNYISMIITQPKGTQRFTIDEIDFDKKDLLKKRDMINEIVDMIF